MSLVLLGGLLLACGQAPAPVTADAPLKLEGVQLATAQGVVLHAARATVDADGNATATQVRAQLPPPQAGADAGAAATGERPPLEIEAPLSDWDMKSRSVRFTGGVRAVRGPVVLTCDQLDVRYADADRMEQAVATGNVEVVRDERRATGDKAVLTTVDGRIELTGSPTLAEGPNTLTGKRIELFLDDERVRCEACRLVVAGDALRAGP